jgi:hypothetical protein
LIHVAGILNKELNRYPVFNKILATCRQTPTLKEYRTVINLFEDFFKIMEEKGHIPEEHFDVCGIRSDKDINGNNVLRTAGISQESFQRSKCLTHSHQVSMRLECLQIIISKEIKKKETANMKHAELVDANKNVVVLICKKLQQEGIIGENADVGEQHVPLCTNKIFKQVNKSSIGSIWRCFPLIYQINNHMTTRQKNIVFIRSHLLMTKRFSPQNYLVIHCG